MIRKYHTETNDSSDVGPTNTFLQLRRQDSNIVTKAYMSLRSHKTPVALPGLSKSQRHISYYDYLPHRKVWSEKDQRQRDRSRRIFKKEVQKEIERQQANEEAKDREIFPQEEYSNVSADEEHDSYLELYFPCIQNSRQTSAQSNASGHRRPSSRRLSIQSLHTFFPDIDNYDFTQRIDPPEDERDTETNKTDMGMGGLHAEIILLDQRKQGGTNESINRRVSFELTAACEDHSEKGSPHRQTFSSVDGRQQICGSNIVRSGKPPIGLREIPEADGQRLPVNKHITRLSMLHGSIQGHMEHSRQLNESRLRSRKSKSAAQIKREPFQEPSSYRSDSQKRLHSAILPVYQSNRPTGFSKSFDPEAFEAPRRGSMGVKRH